MKKTLSVVFALIFALSLCLSVSAVSLVNESTLKSDVASYMGYDENKMQNFNYSKTTQNFLDYFNVTFTYDRVNFEIGVNALGVYENYSYSGKNIIVPKTEKAICIAESTARDAALDAAGVSSGDAIYKSQVFKKQGGVPSYTFNFLGKTAEWTVKVNAITGEIIESNHADQNVFVMFFIRLFAKIAAVFG